jgi:hypothetical protein
MPLKGLLQELELTSERIEQIRTQIMRYLQLDDDLSILMVFLDILESLTRRIDRKRLDRTINRLYEHLGQKRIAWKRMEKQSDKIDKQIAENYLDNGDIEFNYFGGLVKLCKAITEHNIVYFKSMIDSTNGTVFLKRYAFEYLELPGIRLVYLDGTERPEWTLKMFPGRNIDRKTYQIPLTSRIIQMSSGNYPMGTLEYFPGSETPVFSQSGRILLLSHRACCELEEMDPVRKLLTVSRKRYERCLVSISDGIFGRGSPRSGFINYGAVLGDRRWEGFTSVFLFGTPFISDGDMLDDSVLMGINPDPENRDLWENVVRPKMIDFYTVVECRQAIFRIRPISLEELGIECRIYTTIKLDLGIGGIIKRVRPDGLLNFFENEINSKLTIDRYNQISDEITELVKGGRIKSNREIVRELKHRGSLIQFVLDQMEKEGRLLPKRIE